MERDFSSKGVKFYYVYKALAHPEQNGYVQPFTLSERLMHVAEAQRKLGSRIEWICDSMDNDLKHALGDAPNSEFIVAPDGRIVVARRWSSPRELRTDLERLVGRVAQPTSIADIGMKRLEPPQTAPTGVVPRVQLPGRMMPVETKPVARRQRSGSEEPFYVKLRAELDMNYQQRGQGTLYLGFFLDPLYKVHWNNEAAAIEYEVKLPDGMRGEPLRGQGPSVSAKADADPREFLIQLQGTSQQPIEIVVRYFACDDAETFCKPVTQHYLVTLQRDRDGGSRRGSSSGRGRSRFGGRDPRLPPQRPSTRTPTDPETERRLRRAVSLFKRYDRNRDGKLQPAEWRRMPAAPRDSDGDREISLQELLNWLRTNTNDNR